MFFALLFDFLLTISLLIQLLNLLILLILVPEHSNISASTRIIVNIILHTEELHT